MGGSAYHEKAKLDRISDHFERCEIHYFHFLVLFLPVFLKILPKSWGEIILSFFDKIDSKILKIKLFQFLAFKTVVELKSQKN